jgi:hypothetical protein
MASTGRVPHRTKRKTREREEIQREEIEEGG